MNIKKIIIGVFALFSGYIYGQNAYSMSVKNDMLSFSTINDYKTVVGGLEQEQKITFFDYLKKNMDFNSLAKNPNSELYKKMNDDFFEFLVNNEGYISIGENVYKLNPVNSVVVVIPSNKFDTETKAKVDISDYSLPFLRVYSMEDDVLGMVKQILHRVMQDIFVVKVVLVEIQNQGILSVRNHPINQIAIIWIAGLYIID